MNLEDKIFYNLQHHFGYKTFNPGQFEAIKNILEKKSTIAIMPTGGGKSLCYQIPALILNGLTIVVSPLIALMKDQVDKLTALKIPVGLINSSIPISEITTILEKAKKNHIKLLYIAPERFNSDLFKEYINDIEISFLAIDEAHCISQWGHDFRPSYLKLKKAAKILKNPVVGAYTATANEIVKNDIVEQLALQNPKIIIKGFDRPNIKYLTLLLKEKEKTFEVLKILKKLNGPTIIYCSTKKSTDALTIFLKSHLISCEAYHAGLDSANRTKIQNLFINNHIQIIIATNAFGMGIDKPNIRLIIHYNMPGSIEAFYQESGRAGRDGKTSYSLMLGNRHDIAIQKFFINMSYPTEEVIKKVYAYLFSLNENPILKTYKEIAESIKTGKNISEILIGNVLKILESNELIKRLHEKQHPAYFCFNIEFDRIYQRNFTFKSRRKILDFFKNYTLNNHNYIFKYIPFKIDLLLNNTGLTKEQFTRNIKHLYLTNDIYYIPPFTGRGIHKIKEPITFDKLPINFNKIEENRNRQLEKIELVNDYLILKSCKRSYLLSYFGENPKNEKCNACDSCIGWSKKRIIESKLTKKTYDESKELNSKIKPLTRQNNFNKTSSKNDIEQFYLSLLKYNNKIGLNKLIQILQGSKRKDLAEKGLNKCNYFGCLSHLNTKNILEIFTKEKKNGFVKKTKSRLFPKVIITDKGKEKIKEILANN